VDIEFVANRTARVLSDAIEAYARAQGHVSAIVVPWETSATTVSMSVTSVKADGWAIEHTNLGTITLTDLGNDTTAVVVAGHGPDLAAEERLSALLDHFARQLEQHFAAVP
jgi:hypothetical protein